MATVASLRQQVRLLKRRATPVQAPRDYVIALEEDEELSEELRAQLHEHDSLTIRYYPRGFLGIDGASSSGQHMSCWLRGPRGRMNPHVVLPHNIDVSKV